MNWKNEAMEKLRRYSSMQQATYNIPEEIQLLEQDAKALRSPRLDSVARKSGGGRREDALMNNIVKRQELENALDQTRRWLNCTNRALRCLSIDERLILQRLFICPEAGSVQKLCEELGVEQSTIYRKRDRALEKFTISLYGSTES